MIRRMWSGIGNNHDEMAQDTSPQEEKNMQLRTGKSLKSAETLASSTDCKGKSPALMQPAVTKQFTADLSSSSGKSSKRRSAPVRKIWPTSTFSLERQPSGVSVDFDLYEEADLPFLDKSTEVGRMVSKKII